MKFIQWKYFLFLTILAGDAGAQPFYFGADLSYVNEMEDCGAVYKVNGKAQDPYAIFKVHGCNLIRLRLWHTPSWYDELNQGNRYSDFADVRQSILRAKAEGMHVLLDFQLSDNWADPSKQVAPIAWAAVLDDLPVLQDSLYNYIYSTLSKLATENLLPEVVQIGNETNKGILQSQQDNDEGWSLLWPRNSALFNTAIDAVRDIEVDYQKTIKVALHIADPDEVDWLMEQFWDHGVQDFDIIGMSYYYSWHQVLFPFIGNRIDYLKDLYPSKEVMLLETAYPWTQQNADGANNVLAAGYPGYSPSPLHQRDWMITLTQEVIDHGGSGVVYWEPAWVSSNCFTQWAKGSHWDNATFFDFNGELQQAGGIGWMGHAYDFTLATTTVHSLSGEIEIVQAGNEIILSRSDESLWNDSLEMEWFTPDGKIMQREPLAPNWNNNKLIIQIPDLISGTYFISLFAKNKLVNSTMFFVK